MQIKEVLEKCDLHTDDKARRRTNVSQTVANISAAEIESGVTIERLEALNVPVFQYGTQITIHGTLPEFNGNARPAGYKSIVKNGNGTVGVRYVAIDGEKKQRLVEWGRYVKGDWDFSLDSKGLRLFSKRLATRDEAKAAYDSFPRDMFAGTVSAVQDIFGGWWIIVEVGAIPEVKYAALVQYLFGKTIAEIEAIKAAKDAETEVEDKRREAEYAEKVASAKADKEAALAAVAATITLPTLNAVPKNVGDRFVTLNYNVLKNEARAVLYVVVKKVFGKLYLAAVTYDGTNGNWQPEKGCKTVALADRMTTFETRIENGWFWKV
jgi:hypothetical protein